jgi:hypothetical protein
LVVEHNRRAELARLDGLHADRHRVGPVAHRQQRPVLIEQLAEVGPRDQGDARQRPVSRCSRIDVIGGSRSGQPRSAVFPPLGPLSAHEG